MKSSHLLVIIIFSLLSPAVFAEETLVAQNEANASDLPPLIIPLPLEEAKETPKEAPKEEPKAASESTKAEPEPQRTIAVPPPVIQLPITKDEVLNKQATPAEQPKAEQPKTEEPAEQPKTEAAKPEQTKEEPKNAEETGTYVDPEFGMLPPASTDESGADGNKTEMTFQLSVEFGGEYRSRIGQDLQYEYSLTRDYPNGPPVAKGTEDVFDWRNSFQFWTRIELNKNIQTFLELYAEHSIVCKRNEDQPTVIFNGKDYRHNFDLDIWEAYFDLFYGSFDFRIGNQIISWGTITVMSPSDRINARNMDAFYWSDISGARKPVVAAKGVYHVNDLNFELVWIPFYSPPPVSMYGGDFSLFRYGSVYGFTTYPVPAVDSILDKSKTITNYPDLMSTKSPDANPMYSQAGFRFSGNKGGVDFGISYLFAYEEIANTDMDPEVRALVKSLPIGDSNIINGYLQSLQKRIENGESLDELIHSRYERRHSVAAEFGTTIWEFGVKAELAFLPNKTYYHQDFSNGNYHTLAYAASVDIMKTDLGELSTIFFDLEVFGSSLFGVEDGAALIFASERNLGLHANLRMAFLDDDLEIEATSQVNFSSRDFALIPKISYKPVQNLSLSLGVMILEAWQHEPRGFDRYTSNPDRKDAQFGMFSNNDQAFFMLKYKF